MRYYALVDRVMAEAVIRENDVVNKRFRQTSGLKHQGTLLISIKATIMTTPMLTIKDNTSSA